ncbi:hypothetical protein HRbin08_01918 [bacterium HR08]|nr:hypothetical protein HRbin08_01918 [bacterium HR08]
MAAKSTPVQGGCDGPFHGKTNHVAVVSEVDPQGRPSKLADATGPYPQNPGGRAIEHPWTRYFEEKVQGHARPGLAGQGVLRTQADGPVQALRISLGGAGLRLQVSDGQGRWFGDVPEEAIAQAAAGNVEEAIPYLPRTFFEILGGKQVITVYQPLENGLDYDVEVVGPLGAPYTLRLETLQDGVVTAARDFSGVVGSSGADRWRVRLEASSGTIGLAADGPFALPQASVPEEVAASGTSGETVRVQLIISEVGGVVGIDGVTVTGTDLATDFGAQIPAGKLTIAPNAFAVPAGARRTVEMTVDLGGVAPGVYRGALVVASANASVIRVPLTVDVRPVMLYLPIITKSYAVEAESGSLTTTYGAWR